MMDLDFFKQVNDVQGHPAGDSLLKTAAELLVDNCRAGDTVCRYGGEEFAILLPETNETDAATWAERTRQRLASLRIPMRPQDIRISGSFGVAQCRDDMHNSEELVNMADQSLLCAKRMGRDRVVNYTSVVDAADLSQHPSQQQDQIFDDIRARDVMSPLGACLHENATIDEAARFLLRTGIPSSPVLDTEGRLVGFVSEKEIMAAMASPDCWQRAVNTAMRTNVIRYEEDTPIRVVYEFLCRVAIHRVVITKEGRPTGTISRDALLRWFRNWVINKGLVSQPLPCQPSYEYSTTGTASAPGLRTPDTALAAQWVE
jgi:diguanylate cyclase (GGDEF)-like protein